MARFSAYTYTKAVGFARFSYTCTGVDIGGKYSDTNMVRDSYIATSGTCTYVAIWRPNEHDGTDVLLQQPHSRAAFRPACTDNRRVDD